MALTDVQIRNTKPAEKPIKLTDSGGLYLEVRPRGSKLWRYRYRIAGKENVFAIGKYPDVSLSDARFERDHAKALVKQGIHPSHNRQTELLAKQAANANSFEEVAREWIEKKGGKWTPSYRRQVERYMAADVYPNIGRLPIRGITSAHLLAILQRVEERGAETVALLIRQSCSAIFCYAVATLRADHDPAAALKGAIQRPKVRHRKSLTPQQIKEFLQLVAVYRGEPATAIALQLMLLTFVRPGELRQAQWQEFNLDKAEWRIPAERMKMGEMHIVPLSRQARALLLELYTYTGNRSYLFPNRRNPKACITSTTMNRALERMGLNGKNSIGFSSHGFRATASTILNEQGYRSDVIERQLAHAERNKVRASYNHAEYLIERQTLMQHWADYIEGLVQLERDDLGAGAVDDGLSASTLQEKHICLEALSGNWHSVASMIESGRALPISIRRLLVEHLKSLS